LQSQHRRQTDDGVVKDAKFFPKGKQEGEPIEGAPAGGLADMGRAHFRNFIDCVRSRKREQLHDEILEGHRSTLLAHLGNISYRLGVKVPFGKHGRPFGDDRLAGEAFEDLKRHLVDDGKVKLSDVSYRLGHTLPFDPQAERFVGNPAADKMLTHSYRAPFTVPEKV
jgi:hypothetical protein